MKQLKFVDPMIGIFILRVVSGSFMLTHGYMKLNMLLSDQPVQFLDFLGLGATFSLALATFAEFLCALLVVLGIKTRLAVLPLIFTMLVAAFIAHGADPFAKKEMALLYLTIYTALFFTGGGKLSLVKD
ncbi:MAG: DoxX family protein [Bdellovibrionales bacterium]|nr:DoxX family protein [Bdellovibrionales bacterium]